VVSIEATGTAKSISMGGSREKEFDDRSAKVL
jgi:hypothetical protein